MAKLTENERIDALKNFLGISLKDIALRSKLKPFNFYDIKKGKCGISGFVAERVCAAFPQINLKWLLSGEGEMVVSQAPMPASSSVSVPSTLLESLYAELHALRQEVAALNQRIDSLEAKRASNYRVSNRKLSLAAEP